MKRLRRTLRAAVDRAVGIPWVFRALRTRMHRGITILTYHRVLEDAESAEYHLPGLVVPLSQFRRQVRWLDSNFRVTTVEDALRGGRRWGGRNRPTVCLTFDDGYRDNYEIVAPLLEEVGVRGTFYVSTGFVRGDHSLWFDVAALAWSNSPSRCAEVLESAGDGDGAGSPGAPLKEFLARLKRFPADIRARIIRELEPTVSAEASNCGAMEAREVSDLSRRGHEIGSHTVSHEILTTVPDDGLRAELEDSRRDIRRWTGRYPAGLCYPNGDFDARVGRLASEAGYSHACSTLAGINRPNVDPFALRRFEITRTRASGADGAFGAAAMAGEVTGVRESLRRGGRALLM